MQTDMCVPCQPPSWRKLLTCFTSPISTKAVLRCCLLCSRNCEETKNFGSRFPPSWLPYLGPQTPSWDQQPTSGGLAAARGPLRTRARKWLAFWEFIELLRLLVEVKAHWETRFTHPLVNALHVTEMLAMPSLRHSILWATGDATLDRWSFISWTTG